MSFKRFASQFKKIGPQDRRSPADLTKVITDMQDNVQEAMIQLDRAQILSGVYLRDVVLNTTGVDVPHRLERQWKGFIVTKLKAAAIIYSSTSPDDNNYIRLIASTGTPTVDVLVF